MFDEPIDILMLEWHKRYEINKDKIIQDDEFAKTKERKEMNKFIEAIVLLYSSKNGRP